MQIDASLVRTLNLFGEHHRSLVRIFSINLVYTVVILSILWFCAKILKAYPFGNGWKVLVSNLIVKGFIIFMVPVGIATLVSKTISAIFIRQRPFVADPSVYLLVPHASDGGMPSHHITFMVALVTTIYFYEKKFAVLLAFLTLISGVARVAAGIHYPSDIIAGFVLGACIAYLCRRVLAKYPLARITESSSSA